MIYLFTNTSQSYGVSLVIWDHTVLPATNISEQVTPARQGHAHGRQLSRWLVLAYQDGFPVSRQSPIQVVMGTIVEQLS